MKDRDLIYSCVTVVLLVLIGILFWNNMSLKGDCRFINLQNSLQEDLLRSELEPFYLEQASENGLYFPSEIVLFGDANSTVDFYIKNIGVNTKNLSLVILPNLNLITNIPYENISLGYYRGNFTLDPGAHIKFPVIVHALLYDFEQPTINNTLPQFFVLLRGGNITYNAGNFTVFAIPQKAIDEL